MSISVTPLPMVMLSMAEAVLNASLPTVVTLSGITKARRLVHSLNAALMMFSIALSTPAVVTVWSAEAPEKANWSITLTEAGIAISVKLVQSLKLLTPIVSTACPITALARLVQLSNAVPGTSMRALPRTTEGMDPHIENAEVPIVFTASGRTIADVKDTQFANALLPKLVSESGNEIASKEEHDAHAFKPIVSTLFPNVSDVREEQPCIASSPTVTTPSGMSKAAKLVHPENIN